MDYKAKLQTNNLDLNEILGTINNLPEASGGSGGTQFKVLSLTITMSNPDDVCLSLCAPFVDEQGNVISLNQTIENGNTYLIAFDDFQIDLSFQLAGLDYDAYITGVEHTDTGGDVLILQLFNGATDYEYYAVRLYSSGSRPDAYHTELYIHTYVDRGLM